MKLPNRFLAVILAVIPLSAQSHILLAEDALPNAQAPSCHPTNPLDASTPMLSQSTEKMKRPDIAVPPSGPNIEVSDTQDSHGEHTKVILFKDFLIDRIYPSMKGPWKEQPLKMLPTDQSQWAWITQYRAEVIDSETGVASQEYMCHTNLRVKGTAGAPLKFQPERAELSISQGQKEVVFPKGFGLRVENTPERQMNVMVMVLNNNEAHIHRNLDFKATVRYYDDAAATQRHLIPLIQTSAYTSCLVDPKEGKPGETVCRPATPPDINQWLDGRQRTGHWIVPPGRQTVTHDVTKIMDLPYDTTLHYIWMHVHPYAESIELTDVTTGKTVWKGFAKNPRKADLAQVLSTDSYSSTKGIPVFKTHQYSLTTVYNNRSSHDVDAMAALWMYIQEKL